MSKTARRVTGDGSRTGGAGVSPRPPPSQAAGSAAVVGSQEAHQARMASLARTVEQEIIPRLMLVHRLGGTCAPRQAGAAAQGIDALWSAPTHEIEPRHVEAFARLVMSHGDEEVLACVHDLRRRGVPIDALYADLLAGTARHLGDLWTEDLCDFTDVTVGLGRLQQVLRDLSQLPELGGPTPPQREPRRVLMMPCPGEQHTFGLVMVSEFFRRAGWDVTGGAWESEDEALQLVRTQWFDVIGLSLAAEVHLDGLRDCIERLRRDALNRGVGIIVGGPLFLQHPQWAQQVGADGVSCDGRQAPALAEQLVIQRTQGG